MKKAELSRCLRGPAARELRRLGAHRTSNDRIFGRRRGRDRDRPIRSAQPAPTADPIQGAGMNVDELSEDIEGTTMVDQSPIPRNGT